MSGMDEVVMDPKVQDYCVPGPNGLQCACSSSVVARSGEGDDAQSHFKKQYFYLQQTGEDEFAMWTVNPAHLPSGEKRTVTMAEVMAEYNPEVDYYVQKVAPELRKLRKHIARGDKHRHNNQPYSAEMEYQGALAMDKENVRATFGLGLTYLQFNEPRKGAAVFENLINIEGAFDPEYKHLFNEFGIRLRKSRLYPQAVDYYTRALELCPDDENLHFNVARSHFENKDWLLCIKHLCLALEMKEDHEKGLLFAKHLRKRCGEKQSGMAGGLGDFAETAVSHLTAALAGDSTEARRHLADLRGAVQDLLGEGEGPAPEPESAPEPAPNSGSDSDSDSGPEEAA